MLTFRQGGVHGRQRTVLRQDWRNRKGTGRGPVPLAADSRRRTRFPGGSVPSLGQRDKARSTLSALGASPRDGCVASDSVLEVLHQSEEGLRIDPLVKPAINPVRAWPVYPLWMASLLPKSASVQQENCPHSLTPGASTISVTRFSSVLSRLILSNRGVAAQVLGRSSHRPRRARSVEQARLVFLGAFFHWPAKQLIGAGGGDTTARRADDELLAQQVRLDVVAEGVDRQVHRCRQSFDAGRPAIEDADNRF